MCNSGCFMGWTWTLYTSGNCFVTRTLNISRFISKRGESRRRGVRGRRYRESKRPLPSYSIAYGTASWMMRAEASQQQGSQEAARRAVAALKHLNGWRGAAGTSCRQTKCLRYMKIKRRHIEIRQCTLRTCGEPLKQVHFLESCEIWVIFAVLPSGTSR